MNRIKINKLKTVLPELSSKIMTHKTLISKMKSKMIQCVILSLKEKVPRSFMTVL
jgi:hypothetical protein